MGDDAEAGPERDDRRAHQRQPVELKIEYQRLNTFFADYTRNISRGGTFIRTDAVMAAGTELLFKLYVPTLAEPLRVRGQVQWCGTDERTGEPGLGIRFVYIDANERAHVERVVEKLMIESLGQRLYSKLMQRAAERATPSGSDEREQESEG